MSQILSAHNSRAAPPPQPLQWDTIDQYQRADDQAAMPAQSSAHDARSLSRDTAAACHMQSTSSQGEVGLKSRDSDNQEGSPGTLRASKVLQRTTKLSVSLSLERYSEMRPFLFSTLLGAAAATITPYALPKLYSPSSLFKLSANGVDIPVTSNTNYEYARFAMGPGGANLVVETIPPTAVQTVRISPAKYNIVSKSNGTTVAFTLPHDAYIIVKVNALPELVIIADAPETDVPPARGNGIHNVLDAPYHADCTGLNLTTASFQDAIDNATAQFSSESGQSHAVVYVPDGVYTVGNLYLKSNVAFYLEPSAVLRFSGVFSDYRQDYFKTSQNRGVTWWISTAFGSHNVKVYGRGTFEGNGFNATTFSSPQIGNNILVPIATTNFEAKDVTVRDSGAWSVTPIRSSGVTFTNIKFLNRLDMGENDCIDVNESQFVKIDHCIGISLDDPFSTKSWTTANSSADISQNWPGNPQPVKDVVFNDLIAWTRTFGFKIGQGVFQPHTNVTFSNGVVYDCSIGIGIDHRYGSTAASFITWDTIDIESVSLMLLNRSSWEAIFTEDPDATGPGPVTDLFIRNINVRDAGLTGGTLQGLPGFPIKRVTFQHVIMPNSTRPARTLDEMRITARDLYQNVTILP